MSDEKIRAILAQAKELAKEYRKITGKPLGITGEVAEYEAARLLGLNLTSARQPGYDATEVVDGQTRRLQIKGRCVLPSSKLGQRIGSIDINHEFDAVLLVLLDEDLEASVIHEAPRDAVIAALERPGSRARTERGSLAISQFKAISRIRWLREQH